MEPPYNVLITGSTKGVGRALAEEFLRLGDNVVVCSKTPEAVEAAVESLSTQFGKDRVRGMPCNVSKGQQVKELADFAKAEFGHIDLWINNAGAAV